MRTRKLTYRLVALSFLWIVPAMALSAAIIFWSYHNHMLGEFDEQAYGHLKGLMDSSRIDADSGFELARRPVDPRYQIPGSGWYWQISQGEQVMARSRSLGSHTLDIEDIPPGDIALIPHETGTGKLLRVQTLRLQTPTDEPIVFIATIPNEIILQDVRSFGIHVAAGFAVLAAGLLIALVFQVHGALRPLRRMRAEISDIRSGRRQTLGGYFPVEVQPLADELNNFIEHDTLLLTRARNQLGDLAHAVKNPLAVINNAASKLEGDIKSLVLDQTRNISSGIEHHLSRARSLGQADVLGKHADVCKVVDDLLFVMRHTFRSRQLVFDVSLEKDCRFRGDAQDLEEMVGNILENACKWARGKVWLRCECHDRRMTLTVEDDGPGIPQDHRTLALGRGWKADETKPGHGLGLGIADDLARLYNGTLELEKSQFGGLRAKLVLPAI